MSIILITKGFSKLTRNKKQQPWSGSRGMAPKKIWNCESPKKPWPNCRLSSGKLTNMAIAVGKKSTFFPIGNTPFLMGWNPQLVLVICCFLGDYTAQLYREYHNAIIPMKNLISPAICYPPDVSAVKGALRIGEALPEKFEVRSSEFAKTPGNIHQHG